MDILIIDDNAAVRDMLAIAVGRAGHRAIAAGNGRDGLALLENASVDVVVTDVFMPECDGIEVIREIRGRWPEVPVVAISGGSPSLDQNYLGVARRLGASAALEKPFAAEDLMAVIGQLALPRAA